MPEEVSQPMSPLEKLKQADEQLTARLSGEVYSGEDLMVAFNDYEVATHLASGAGEISADGAFEQLLTQSQRALERAEAGEDTAGTLYFAAKIDTYRSLVDATAPKPAAQPQPTDPATKGMSGKKSTKK